MQITNLTTDDAVLEEVGQRISRHRLQRDLTQAELAAEAGISKRTLERIEAGQSVQVGSLLRVLRVLGRLGGLEQLLPEPGPSPMEYLERNGQERQRASSATARPERSAAEWAWGADG